MESTYRLDRYERRILDELQMDGRLSQAELGRRVGLSPTAIADRIRQLESAGVIRGYRVVVDPVAIGLPVVCLITMTCDGERCRRLAVDVAAMPEVLECYRVTGDASALLKVALPSIEALEVLVDRLSTYGKPSTAIVLSTPLTGRPLPTGHRAPVGRSATNSSDVSGNVSAAGRPGAGLSADARTPRR